MRVAAATAGASGPLASPGQGASMKISSIETGLYRIPMAEPLVDSTVRLTDWELVVARVRTDTNLTGVGWSYTIGTGGTAIRALIDDALAPHVLGQDPLHVERINERLWWAVSRMGTGLTSFAIAPLDIALWDVIAKSAGRPLYEVLGGCRERIPAYGSGINFHLDIDGLLEQMQGYLDRGYRAVKMKVGKPEPEEDLERVRAVRRLIGPRVALMVDANLAWTAGEAVRRAAMLEPYDIAWLEEPLPQQDIGGHARVRAACSIPIAVGENLYTKHAFAEYLRSDAVDIIQADVCRVGGISEWMKIAHLAHAWNLVMAPHIVYELSVSLLCAVQNALIAEVISGGTLTDLGVLAEPLLPVDGVGTPPRHPGHGVVFDEQALARYAVKSEGASTAPSEGLPQNRAAPA
jgi:L-alanine-DL-glutamate epimerase-like enolase superfamily enzyme